MSDAGIVVFFNNYSEQIIDLVKVLVGFVLGYIVAKILQVRKEIHRENK